MSSTNGSREVLEAARKRLASAKSQRSVASKNLKMQQQMLNSAKSMSEAADKEYKEAKMALENAEKKYEVIDIDNEDDNKGMFMTYEASSGSDSSDSEDSNFSGGDNAVNRVSIPEDITSIDQLQWYRIKLIQTEQYTKERLQPCRVLSLGEAAKHYQYKWHNNLTNKVVIQYITFPNIDKGIYKTIDNNNNSFVPFGYRSNNGSITFNDDYLQRYTNQQSTKYSGLESEKLYMKRLFMHAADMERKARENRKRDCQGSHKRRAIDHFHLTVDSSSSDSDDSESAAIQEDRAINLRK